MFSNCGCVLAALRRCPSPRVISLRGLPARPLTPPPPRPHAAAASSDERTSLVFRIYQIAQDYISSQPNIKIPQERYPNLLNTKMTALFNQSYLNVPLVAVDTNYHKLSIKNHLISDRLIYPCPPGRRRVHTLALAALPMGRRRVHTLAPADVPSVSVPEMKRALKQAGLAPADGPTALAARCPACDPPGPDSTLFVNKTTGYFTCPACEAHGEWSVLVLLLRGGAGSAAGEAAREQLRGVRAARDRFRAEWARVASETTALGGLDARDVEELFRRFDYPHQPECVKALQEVRCSPDRATLYFPLRNGLETVVGYRAVRAGEARAEGAGHHAAGLFAYRAVRAAGAAGEQAVLVPTVRDLLCLVREKVPGALVWWCDALLPPALLAALERYSRLVVWGARDNIRGVGDKLGQERCRFVRPIDGATSAAEAAAAAGGRSLRAAVAEAAPAAHRSITTFEALRGDVYAALTNVDKARGVKWSRFPALTRLLGGHRRGELTVLTGPTGCGKTTLTAEMSLDLAAKGVNTLWGSFEIRNSRLAQTMLQQHTGVPLEENLHRFDEFAERFQRLPIYFLAFHGPQPIKTVMETVEHARYVHDIAHVIIDNVQFMLGLGEAGGGGGGGERYFRQDAVVAAFRSFATRRDCHCTLVMHPRKERDSEDLSTSSIFGSAKASQEADNVLIIQDKRLTAVRGKKFLQVAKNRFSGDLGVVPLEFDKAALSYQARRRPPREGKEPAGAQRKDSGPRAVGGGGGESFLSDVLGAEEER